jgi:hypothetical protein
VSETTRRVAHGKGIVFGAGVVYNRGDEGKVENLRKLTGDMLAECRESCTPHIFVVKGGFRVCVLVCVYHDTK